MGGPGAARGRGAACLIREQSIIKTAQHGQTENTSALLKAALPCTRAVRRFGIIFPAHSTLYRPAICWRLASVREKARTMRRVYDETTLCGPRMARGYAVRVSDSARSTVR